MSRKLIVAAALLALAAPARANPSGSAWTQEPIGTTAIFHLATAPFPHPSRTYTDDRVMLYVPAGYRPGPTVDLVIQYHGHRNEIVHSDAQHHYREQLFLSKKNAVLVEPQGPLNAADSGGGKHEDANGLRRFVAEVVAVLAREGAVPQGATAGRVILSGHSGAYHVIAAELARGGVDPSEVHLHDALYGELAPFESWAAAPGHKLVSTYTLLGGTAANNETLRRSLAADGIGVAATDDDASLATARALVLRTDVVHEDVTHQRMRWAEVLAHSGALGDLGVPRAKLRSVKATGGEVEVAWYPSRSSVCRGWRLQGADDPDGPFALERALPASATSARVPDDGRSWRVVAVDDLGRESAPSNAYSARGGDRAVLVVDGFVRATGGWRRGDHGFAALVGSSIAAAGRAFDACRASAVTDGSVRLGDYASVVWLAGDQSTADASLGRDEKRALASYLAAGGTLMISGSELGWDLALPPASPDDRAFFADVLHASFVADATPSRALAGLGSFAGLSASFGGAAAPYAVRTPDVLAPRGGAVAIKYGAGGGAAIAFEGPIGGAARSGVLTFGLPIEAADGAPSRDAIVARALAWMDGVNQRAGR